MITRTLKIPGALLIRCKWKRGSLEGLVLIVSRIQPVAVLCHSLDPAAAQSGTTKKSRLI